MVTSAFERDIRERLDRLDPSRNDFVNVRVSAGVLRGILADLDMWKRNAGLVAGDDVPPREIVQAVILLLPDDKEKGLRILDQARAMVERFKR